MLQSRIIKRLIRDKSRSWHLLLHPLTPLNVDGVRPAQPWVTWCQIMDYRRLLLFLLGDAEEPIPSLSYSFILSFLCSKPFALISRGCSKQPLFLHPAPNNPPKAGPKLPSTLKSYHFGVALKPHIAQRTWMKLQGFQQLSGPPTCAFWQQLSVAC